MITLLFSSFDCDILQGLLSAKHRGYCISPPALRWQIIEGILFATFGMNSVQAHFPPRIERDIYIERRGEILHRYLTLRGIIVPTNMTNMTISLVSVRSAMVLATVFASKVGLEVCDKPCPRSWVCQHLVPL